MAIQLAEIIARSVVTLACIAAVVIAIQGWPNRGED